MYEKSEHSPGSRYLVVDNIHPRNKVLINDVKDYKMLSALCKKPFLSLLFKDLDFCKMSRYQVVDEWRTFNKTWLSRCRAEAVAIIFKEHKRNQIKD